MNSSEEEDKQEYTRYRRDADGFKATTEIIPPADREGTELDPSDSLVREFLSWGMASKDADIWHASLLWLKSVNWLDKPYFDFAKKHFFSPSKITRQIAADVFIAHDTTFAGFENVSSYYIWEKSKAAFFAREYNRMFEGDRDINVGCGWGAGPGGEVTLPILNWPLPPSSVRDVIPLVKYKTAKVESLHQAITRILSQKGYPYRFFTVPNGYAIVTQVEQMNGDGSLAARDRWILKRTSSSAWKLGTFLNGNEGWFRQFYFVINTNPNFKDNGELFKTVTKFLTNFEEGGFVLPEEVKNTPLKNMYLNVLVYQFYKKNGGVIRTIRKGENPLPASTHLRVLGITEF